MENVINFNELNVDKENEVVSYNDELHKYWIKDSKQTCISVTTLIKKFDNFDEEFWASYKALEAVATPQAFSEVKKALLDSKIFLESYLDKTGVDKETFDKRRGELLEEWKVKRDESCVRGTAIHKKHELQHLAGKTQEIKKLGLGGTFSPNLTNKIQLGEQRVYPELLLSYVSEDGELRLAGQADLVIVDGNDVYILDYKTNKSIDKKGFYDRAKKKSTMMKFPLNNLEDTNFWHYTVQLSTYAWMIQQALPDANIKILMLIHYDHDGNETTYECEYLLADVIRMLDFYKKEIVYEKFKAARKKQTF